MASMAAQHGLTEGIVWKKRLGFFFPILLGLLFQQLYNTADAVIAGRFEGDSALAAVGGGAATIINMIIVMPGICVFRVLWILIAVPLWHTIFAVAIVYAISWIITEPYLSGITKRAIG